MAPCTDWTPLLKDLEQLRRTWLTKAEAESDDQKWSRSVLFGIETGLNRIAEEVAKADPRVSTVISDWQRHLRSREDIPGQEVVEGVDHGIKLVIECVRQFFNSTAPKEPPRSDNNPNGDPEIENY
jgi:hypothetical protein